MADVIAISIPRPQVTEGTAFTATAYFRNRSSSAASVPTTAKYRIDCLSTGNQVRDWTTLTPSASISIAISPSDNATQDDANDSEVRQLTVMADEGLSTQVVESARWSIENLYGSP